MSVQRPAPVPMSDQKLMTVPEAALQLGIGVTNTWKLVWSGELPSVRIGRAVRVDPAAIRAFVDAHSTKVTDPR